MMRSLLLAAALAGAAPSEPVAPTGAFGLVVSDVVDAGMRVDGTLHVRQDQTFLLECRISGDAWGPASRTAVWGTVTVDGAVVIGRVAGGEDRRQLPGRHFVLRFGDPQGGWTSNVPGCPQEGRVPR